MKNKGSTYFSELFLPVDLATIFYVLISGLYLCFGSINFPALLPHLIIRIFILVLIVVLSKLQRRFSANKPLQFIRNFYPLLFLVFFYAETSSLKNTVFTTNLDNYFFNAEQKIWGFQPSIVFSKVMNREWFNEMMNMCYFSYYILIPLVCFALYFKKPAQSVKGVFTVIFSFYLYYIIFCVLPVAGPQYYIIDQAYPTITPHFFGNIMHNILTNHEEPTGAFPSSHVGIAVIINYLAFVHLKKLFFITLPFVVGICFATVYTRAHYLVDVFGGLVSAPLFIFLSYKVYNKFDPDNHLKTRMTL
ncbi:MAG: phosphatase PAP2 family protein [Bacteroidetes bacterium]|nr:phosphatase PAP2 family protein [Bacteroidota bacterium]